MKWYCYGCGRTQPRIEVECRCEWWKRMGPWLREMLDKLICDISPEDTPFICRKVAPDDSLEPVRRSDG